MRTYTLGGTVTGLTGAGLVIQNNAGDNLSISADATRFTFSTTPVSGAAYAVTVLAAPANPTQLCTVANGSGVIGNANVTNVTVHCALGAPTLRLGFGIKQLQFAWTPISGAAYYRLLQNPDGVSGFSPVGANLGPDVSTATLDIAVHKHDWSKARYIVEACNSTGCTNSNDVNTLGSVLSAIGYVKASNTGTNDWFGNSVALSGDGRTLAVGAFGEASDATGINSSPNELAADAGAVYVYIRAGATWSQQAYVKASNTGTVDVFGWSVALSDDGDTLAVGAYGDDSDTTGINTTPNNLALQAGAAYVFTRAASTWSQQAYVKASNTGAYDLFGYSVALSGDGNTLAVGAYGDNSDTTGINSTPNKLALQAGAAYVFTRTADTWIQQAYVKASNTGAADLFGYSVALNNDGNTLAVGAYAEDSSATGINNTPNESAYESGAVYVYTRTGSTWTHQAYVKASNTGADDLFGYSVALSGDGNTLAVGARGETSSSTGINSAPNELAPQSGAVYVYTRSGATWLQQAYVKASNTGVGDDFGSSVALSGDGNTLAVGARGELSNSTGINSTPNKSDSSAGAAYVYTRAANTWAQQAYVKASNTGAHDLFGWSVALNGNGNTLAAGARGEDSDTTGINSTPNESASNTGAVYLF